MDIDSVSRSKQYCMQVISEEKNFRFCAKGENELAKWLGAFKSLLVKRRESEAKKTMALQTPALTTTAATPTLPDAPKESKRVSFGEPNTPLSPVQAVAIK